MTPRDTYRRFAAFQHKLEKKYTPQVQGVFKRQATAFNEYAAKYGFQKAAGNIHDFFDAAPLLPILNNLHMEAGGNYGAAIFKEYRNAKGGVFNAITEIGRRVIAGLRSSLLTNVHGITNTAREATISIVQQGQDNGWGYDKTASKIQDEIGAKWRALRIVRTESIKASNMGAIEGAKATGFEMQKSWISAHDNRVRGNQSGKYPESEFDHYDMDKTTIPIDQAFLLGSRKGASDYLRYPGDPDGSAADIINCRCTLAFIVKRDAAGRPVRARQRTAAMA